MNDTILRLAALACAALATAAAAQTPAREFAAELRGHAALPATTT
jgi:hypothetical protein